MVAISGYIFGGLVDKVVFMGLFIYFAYKLSSSIDKFQQKEKISHSQLKLVLQGDPSGRGLAYVDFRFEVTLHNKMLILWPSLKFDANKM